MLCVQGNCDVIDILQNGEIVKHHCLFGVANQSKPLVKIQEVCFIFFKECLSSICSLSIKVGDLFLSLFVTG